MSIFKEAHDELCRIDNGYKKIRDKVDSAFDEMNKFGMLSFDGLALQSRLGDIEAELRALEGQIEPCKSFVETIHRASPFNDDEMKEFHLTWARIETRRKGIAQALQSACDRLANKNIWAGLVSMVEGILTFLNEALVDLVFELGQLSGRVIKSLPWMEG